MRGQQGTLAVLCSELCRDLGRQCSNNLRVEQAGHQLLLLLLLLLFLPCFLQPTNRKSDKHPTQHQITNPPVDCASTRAVELGISLGRFFCTNCARGQI